MAISQLYKTLGPICILPFIRTFVRRQAEGVRKQFTTSDIVRKRHDQCQNILQHMTTLSQLLY